MVNSDYMIEQSAPKNSDFAIFDCTRLVIDVELSLNLGKVLYNPFHQKFLLSRVVFEFDN